MLNSAFIQDLAIALAAIAVITVPMFVGSFRSPRIDRKK